MRNDRLTGFAMLVVVLSISASCTSRKPPLRPTLPSIQANVFDVHCAVAGCHVSPNPESHLVLESGQSDRSLINVHSRFIKERTLVSPGQPEKSYLLNKLRGERIVGERMPLGRAPLPDSLIATIESWISAGAPPS